MFRKLKEHVHHHQDQETPPPEKKEKEWGIESETGGFPQRKGCKVDLYQDTTANPETIGLAKEGGGIFFFFFFFFLSLSLSFFFFCLCFLFSGKYQYKRGQCWEDIYDAINEAKRFIYITGTFFKMNVSYFFFFLIFPLRLVC